MEMQEGNGQGLSQPVQEDGKIGEVQSALDKSNKLIGEAVGITLFVAFVNIVFGSVINIFPNLFSGGTALEGLNGMGLVLFGLLYMGMALGIQKRSRTCAIIALIVFAADTALTLLGGDFKIVNYGMKVVIIIGLIAGVRGCFSYHTLLKKHQYDPDNRALDMVRADRRKIKVIPLVICILVAAIGIGSTVYSAVNMIGLGGDFDQWESYSPDYAEITLKMPAEVVEESQTITGSLPGITYHTATSDSFACSTLLITYENLLRGQQDSDIAELRKSIISELVETTGAEVLETLEGTVDPVASTDVMVTYQGHPGAFRAFAYGDNLYVAGILANINDDTLVAQFMQSVAIAQ